MKKNTGAGFTLIELSIVIVIIALIVGGVLVGRDLITAAMLRKTGSMVETYRTAVMTFKGKYGAIPGDMRSNQAQQFGFTAPASGQCFNGAALGNGKIDDALYGGVNRNQAYGDSCEAILFWRHMVESGLLPNNTIDVTAPLNANGAPSPDPSTTAEALRYIPLAPIKTAAFYIQKTTSYPVGWISLDKVYGLVASFWSHSGGLTPLQAFNIDTKWDDGRPMGGTIWAIGNGEMTPDVPNLSWQIADTPPCTTGPWNDIKYSTSGSDRDLLFCGLMFFVKEF